MRAEEEGRVKDRLGDSEGVPGTLSASSTRDTAEPSVRGGKPTHPCRQGTSW
jgi:hypothetical protein